MEKWEKQLEKKLNRSVPSLVDNRVEETLQQLPRKKKKKKIYLGLTAAIVAVAMTFGLSILSPAFANTMKEIPIIGSAFEFVGNIGVKKGQNEGLSTELGEQIEVNGQVITFTETLYDGGEVHIGYLIQKNGIDDTTHFTHNLHFLIDGKSSGSYGMGGHISEMKNGLFAGTLSIRFREELPDSFVLGIRPSEGKSWHVELPVEKKGDHQSFLVNHVKSSEDLTILYDKITFFPTSTEISLRLMMDEKAFADDKYTMLDYQVVDDKGSALQPMSGGGGGAGPVNGIVTHSFKYYHEPVQNIPSSLTIKPYLRDINNHPPKISSIKWNGEHINLSQGEIGYLKVLQASEENGVTTFTYEVEGADLYRQANAFWIEDSNGRRYHSVEPAVRVKGTANQYQSSFSEIPDTDDLYLTTEEIIPPNFLEELEVTIDLRE